MDLVKAQEIGLRAERCATKPIRRMPAGLRTSCARTGSGWVHVKSDASYRLRLLLTQRRNLSRKFLDIENAIRHSIKTFGLKLGSVGRGEFETRVRELVADDPLIAPLCVPKTSSELMT
jgi:transposase